MKQVAAAILVVDEKVLCCQRLATCKNAPNIWEFPGGKIEPGETAAQTIKRELFEELGIHPLGEFLPVSSITVTYTEDYQINFYIVTSYIGTVELKGSHQAFRWIPIEKMETSEIDIHDGVAWRNAKELLCSKKK